MNHTSLELRDYYTRAREGADAPATLVGWKNQQAQSNRFEQLIKVLDPGARNFSVNDLGCGLGDLSEFLTSRGFSDFVYMGYDVFDFMIERAEKLHGGTGDRTFRKISEGSEMLSADYSIASGIMNLKFNTPDDVWLQYVLEQIRVLSSKSLKGFAFNALTKYSDPEFMKPELYYSDPCLLFDFCKRHIAQDVALLHDYQEYDFTIIVRKSDGHRSAPGNR